MQQKRPIGRPTIKCFGCGVPHRKVDYPNKMLLGQFVALCGDGDLGNVVYNCPLRNPPTLKQGLVALVNLMKLVPNRPPRFTTFSHEGNTTSIYEEEVYAITRAQKSQFAY